MYIENAYLGKNPKWLYVIPPFVFFAITGLDFVVSKMLNANVEQMLGTSIQKKGELQVFTELMLPFLVFFVVLFLWVRYIHGQPIRAFTTSRAKVDWKRFFFAFFLWGGVITAMTIGDYIANPENFVWNFQPEKFVTLLLLAVLFIPFQAGFEEYFFRGYLMQGLGLFVKNRWLPLFFTSITFGLVHISNPEVAKLGYLTLIYYIGTGFFLGIVTLMDEGLELALGFHIANNLFSAILVSTDWTVFRLPALLRDVSAPSMGVEVFFPLLLFVLLLFIFSRKYGWTNWKEKLSGKVHSEKEFFE
ncbi:CPBP family intramembrane glutamic endopeptidase [Capnocytophaga sp.]|uniref:CPBP family intramembrane glutamic endopeptidase n=1 Tax=Capnocytophaga sp. TaxID=44737 RepID=UPI0026DB2204|nr:CPBP family intramembrane glutamic endopeptidase [Capnocytophaga sp.]MDO5105736.1 CPBP family intramembrane metalloprotease [Capnocytophaga sp.]